MHRKYIANYINPKYWMKNYGLLSRFQFLGMIFGPLVYLILLYVNQTYKLSDHTFTLPGFFQCFVGLSYTIILFFFFKDSFLYKSPDAYQYNEND